MFAAIWSHEAVLEVLLKKGVDPDDPDKVSVHSLHIYNHYSLLSQLIHIVVLDRMGRRLGVMLQATLFEKPFALIEETTW